MPGADCVGVVFATGFGLGIAGHGEIIDDEVGMLRPPLKDPAAFVERTCLAVPGDDFALPCERFMRQFHQLNDWPPERRTARD